MPVAGELEDIGSRLREERDRVGISQRELARRVGLSPSMISQIESGQSKPSVSTLYGIVTELGVSLDDLFGANGAAVAVGDGGSAGGSTHVGPMVRVEDRHVIDLDSGVRWERLTSHQHEHVDFLHVVYDVGGSSASDEKMMRHPGREYGVVLDGRLGVQLGFEAYELGPGDSIAFDSAQPHRLWNLGDVPVKGIWFVVGRDG
ncbi:MAG TPA: helix-turn-helix domain-containing protein [Actinomycetota bacterium]|nr:helix-turn-helix domain-containing protein [Actinomycetota bacterium]